MIWITVDITYFLFLLLLFFFFSWRKEKPLLLLMLYKLQSWYLLSYQATGKIVWSFLRNWLFWGGREENVLFIICSANIYNAHFLDSEKFSFNQVSILRDLRCLWLCLLWNLSLPFFLTLWPFYNFYYVKKIKSKEQKNPKHLLNSGQMQSISRPRFNLLVCIALNFRSWSGSCFKLLLVISH